MSDVQPWYMAGDAWVLEQHRDAPERTIYWESILSQGNGLLGFRGFDEEGSSGRPTVREGYLNGVFAAVDAQATRIIDGDFPWPTVQMVSLPELFSCRILLGGERFDLAQGVVLDYRRSLSLRDGVLRRDVTWRSPQGRTSRLSFARFLSADERALGMQQVVVEAVDWTGEGSLDFSFAACPPSVFRCGNTQEPELPQYHYSLREAGCPAAGTAWVTLDLASSTHHVCVASRLAGEGAVLHSTVEGETVSQTARIPLAPGRRQRVERAFTVVTDRDARDPHEQSLARLPVGEGPVFERALEASRAVWSTRWAACDIEIEGNARDQKVVRFSLFQLLQMAIPPGSSLSIPARALSFNRYRGMYFWDTETFILPAYTWMLPEVAADLLRFRAETLPGAVETARRLLDRAGAVFPWMGDAETGHDNSIDGRVRHLVHQNGDIAYAFDQFGRATGDTAFMCRHALPVLAETARFWMDFLEPDAAGLLHSVWTVGPDEDNGGGRDNGYTNLMARHNLELAAGWSEHLGHAEPGLYAGIAESLGLQSEEMQRWRAAASRIHVPEVPGLGIPLQDEYLLRKPPADMAGWNLRAGRQDWCVPSGFHCKDYRLIKQADIVLAMVLLQDRFDRGKLAAAYDFYEPLTQHISSLSYNTHAIAVARLGRIDQAYEYFERSAALDLDDLKGVTRDGLHAAALGGCWQAVVFGFAGLHPCADCLDFDPCLPPSWKRLRFGMTWRGRRHTICIDADGQCTVNPA